MKAAGIFNTRSPKTPPTPTGSGQVCGGVAQPKAAAVSNAPAADNAASRMGEIVRAYQQRNEAMVNNANYVFAVWTGKPVGGTANCIRYALSQGKDVYNLCPLNGKIRLVKEA